MPTDSLSSDILEAKFGPTELVILQQTAGQRLIATRTQVERKLLEISAVEFTDPGMTAFPLIHAKVLGGMSMGKAFRAGKVAFQRQEQAAFHYELSASLADQFKAGQTATAVAVTILVGTPSVAYASILELYSPAVIWPTLHGTPTSEQLQELAAFDTVLVGSKSLAKVI
jgi:hypothetical protein